MQSSHNVVFGDPLKPVKLDDFRNVLIRQEETIIFALIERAQFPRNPEVYVSMKESKSAAFGGLKGKYTTFDGSLLDFMLLETEKLHALTRRYTSPDENAFFPHLLPASILPSLDYPRVLNPNRININNQIMSVYQEKILPGLTTLASDDTAYGSTATADIAVLQALSKRIHFGKFIAEAKFQAETERYTKLILANDADGIMEALTNLAVEQKVLERVKLKASTYGQDPNAPASSDDKEMKVNPQLISDLYRDFVMPLTKEVQVQYLLQRVAHPSIAVAGAEGSFCWLAAQAHFGGETLDKDQLLQAESISQVFYDVNANRTAYGVVPIEDSRLGMIKETQAQLLRSSLKVSAEIVLTRSFIFAAKDKQLGKNSDVTKVFCPTDTDARLLAQAEQCWPSAQVVSVANVSEAASRAFNEASTVAVTTAGAAESCGLEQVDTSHALASEAGVAESKSFIRFVIVSKGYPAATGKDKSCLSMEIKHEVGSLLSALDVWKKHGINLSCLESIYRQEEGGYDFFVEIVGHFDDENVRQAVEELQSVCTVKHLGSFPIAKRPIQS
ncbi:chorismate mutase [Phytophthora nicotianae CJ01A1]|uniref:chorismate mutase n=7 Tax=Phytophthora nicotianae TaxID=4792 RepID=W2R7G5_PHYN3|nr:chorismate mutase [Phytophthora nicotianae INRA-310]ETI45350.1 chorismate mutase [Phytophthora nicotianae P1569]ETK85273.1 chorismate mutase [Phytophthora nicotianae]ETO73992.1 chorismate mutase [Phytophthora nicotianae P1976]ETP15166.1 chorismate mutase [Phytophthora nicotianae CJ01A1]ETP43191.1 chorismate mutase [Phytophthora nicotianae P10297]